MEEEIFANNVTISRPRSQPINQRRLRRKPFAGVKCASESNRSTEHSNTKEKANETILLHAPRATNLIQHAVDRVPASTFDRVRDEAREHSQRTKPLTTLTSVQNEPSDDLQTSKKTDTMTVSDDIAFQELSRQIANDSYHGRKGRIIREFFGGGTQSGPFPGSRSENGLHAAGAYFKSQRPLGGVWSMTKPATTSDSGYKLK